MRSSSKETKKRDDPVALVARTSAELIVDSSSLVVFGTDDVQAAHVFHRREPADAMEEETSVKVELTAKLFGPVLSNLLGLSHV